MASTENSSEFTPATGTERALAGALIRSACERYTFEPVGISGWLASASASREDPFSGYLQRMGDDPPPPPGLDYQGMVAWRQAQPERFAPVRWFVVEPRRQGDDWEVWWEQTSERDLYLGESVDARDFHFGRLGEFDPVAPPPGR